MKDPAIVANWTTEEIDPKEIALHLHGVLEESSDADSQYDIHLYYNKKRKIPVLTLKIDPANRTICLAVWRSKDSFLVTNKLSQIKTIQFVSWDSSKGVRHSDVAFVSETHDNRVLWSLVVSSYGHQAFA